MKPGMRKTLLLGGVACSVYGFGAIVKDALVNSIDYGTVTKWKSNVDLKGKTYVVTGASSGIGKETAYELARRKANVVMACRDMSRCEDARREIVINSQNKYVYCRQCDLADLSSIRAFATTLSKEMQFRGHLDGLVNNAGVMYAPRKFTVDGFEIQWASNHLGPFLLTHLLMDMLTAPLSSDSDVSVNKDEKQSPLTAESAEGGVQYSRSGEAAKSRVVYLVNVDYRKAKEGLDFDNLNCEISYDKAMIFNRTQLANMLSMLKLSKDAAILDPNKVTVAAVYPGACHTLIKRYMGIYRSTTAALFARPFVWLISRTANQGAQNVIFALLDPAVTDATGQLIAHMKSIDIEQVALDGDAADRLYATDLYWSGLVTDRQHLNRQLSMGKQKT